MRLPPIYDAAAALPPEGPGQLRPVLDNLLAGAVAQQTGWGPPNVRFAMPRTAGAPCPGPGLVKDNATRFECACGSTFPDLSTMTAHLTCQEAP